MSITESDLETVQRNIATLERECSAKMRTAASMSYNDAHALKTGPMKRLEELRRLERQLLRKKAVGK